MSKASSNASCFVAILPSTGSALISNSKPIPFDGSCSLPLASSTKTDGSNFFAYLRSIEYMLSYSLAPSPICSTFSTSSEDGITSAVCLSATALASIRLTPKPTHSLDCLPLGVETNGPGGTASASSYLSIDSASASSHISLTVGSVTKPVLSIAVSAPYSTIVFLRKSLLFSIHVARASSVPLILMYISPARAFSGAYS